MNPRDIANKNITVTVHFLLGRHTHPIWPHEEEFDGILLLAGDSMLLPTDPSPKFLKKYGCLITMGRVPEEIKNTLNFFLPLPKE